MSNQNSRVKCVEVSERELDGVVERAQFAQKLLKEIAQEAYSESLAPADAKGELAMVLRDQAQTLKEFLEKNFIGLHKLPLQPR